MFLVLVQGVVDPTTLYFRVQACRELVESRFQAVSDVDAVKVLSVTRVFHVFAQEIFEQRLKTFARAKSPLYHLNITMFLQCTLSVKRTAEYHHGKVRHYQ